MPCFSRLDFFFKEGGALGTAEEGNQNEGVRPLIT